ncbi:MAG: nucleotide exchange factor GrpE [Candidatus Diapherotrites archaeon]|nr:nucleotide exchange factor GrpE [Candidatus Diapherotrites archaeon]
MTFETKSNEKEGMESPTPENNRPSENNEEFNALMTKKQAEMQDYINDLKRLQADFENYRKRVERERTEYVKHANFGFLREILALLDSVQSAVHKLENEKEFNQGKAVHGLQLLEKQFKEFLKKHGVHEIQAQNCKCDPAVHEVVLQGTDNSKPDEMILEELQKGYLLHDKVLRSAKVKVNKLDSKIEK